MLVAGPMSERPSVFLKPNSGQTSIEDGGAHSEECGKFSRGLFFFSLLL